MVKFGDLKRFRSPFRCCQTVTPNDPNSDGDADPDRNKTHAYVPAGLLADRLTDPGADSPGEFGRPAGVYVSFGRGTLNFVLKLLSIGILLVLDHLQEFAQHGEGREAGAKGE